MGGPSLIFFKILPSDHMCICEEDSALLTKHVSYREILSTLKSMAKEKNPGPGGLNVDFYLFYWDIIKVPLFNAISHFLSTA